MDATLKNPLKGLNERLALRVIAGLSLFVTIAVAVLMLLPAQKHIPEFVYVLPTVNAFLNGSCFVLLLASLYFIRKRNYVAHMQLNIVAFVLSSLFLVSYIAFHAFGIETKFPATNAMRPLYLVVLSTHIVLAAIVLPLVLLSFYRALTGQYAKHKKVVRWAYPIWLYVTSTGVIVYLMISPYYKY